MKSVWMLWLGFKILRTLCRLRGSSGRWRMWCLLCIHRDIILLLVAWRNATLLIPQSIDGFGNSYIRGGHWIFARRVFISPRCLLENGWERSWINVICLDSTILSLYACVSSSPWFSSLVGFSDHRFWSPWAWGRSDPSKQHIWRWTKAGRSTFPGDFIMRPDQEAAASVFTLTSPS